ncbi:MAG: SDR family oxidoreductase [Chloroflexota bacterium]
MSQPLSGQVALITGASSGIGRAVAVALAGAGADVALAARTQGELEETARLVRQTGRRALVQVTDVSDEAQVKELVARTLAEFARLDILVNNAGTNARGPVEKLSLEGWQRTIGVNATGAFLCSREVLPALRRQGGKIVNIVSGRGTQGGAGSPAYSASKFAMRGLSQSLADEVRDDSITVSCVLPGPTDTPLRNSGRPNEDRSLLLAPEDVAEVILFLATRPANVIISEVPVRPRRYFSGIA